MAFVLLSFVFFYLNRVEISDGSRNYKALISPDAKNSGIGKVCIAGTINLICWSRTSLEWVVDF